jgi:hypothetical protein
MRSGRRPPRGPPSRVQGERQAKGLLTEQRECGEGTGSADFQVRRFPRGH